MSVLDKAESKGKLSKDTIGNILYRIYLYIYNSF